jgi:D-tyrosyl-tRNA(Tyr) deacylase
MRAVVQRVTEAAVSVDGVRVAVIGPGLLVLCGVAPTDGETDIDWLARKIASLRVFDDADGVMNRSIGETGGDILAVSQFTLHASTRKGARPSYSAAAPPEQALPLFEAFVRKLEGYHGRRIATGVFGAHMHVSMINDGPVTLWLDTTARE